MPDSASKTRTDRTTFDAIVVGSGIAGGWAAKELCEKGLKTLVLERGRNVEHIKDYPTANLAPWQLPHRGRLTRKVVEENPVMSVIAAEDVQHFFVKDAEHPYVQEKPFDWIRGYQVGGKSIMWGRACQRWSHVRVHGAGAPWLRDRLADRLRRHRSVVLARRALHRRVRHRATGSSRCPTGNSCRRSTSTASSST